MWTLALSSMNVKALTKNDKSLLVGRPVVPRPNVKYMGLDLTLIGCIEISANARLEL